MVEMVRGRQYRVKLYGKWYGFQSLKDAYEFSRTTGGELHSYDYGVTAPKAKMMRSMETGSILPDVEW